MKRGGSLPRRTPLQTKTGLNARTSGLRFRRRSAVETRENARVRDAVFDRDGWTCRLKGADGVFAHSCSGLTVHHLLKSSQGGEYDQGNLVTLCSVANDLIEDHPQRAWELGLVVRRGETTADAWGRMAAAGLVDYGPDGGPLVRG